MLAFPLCLMIASSLLGIDLTKISKISGDNFFHSSTRTDFKTALLLIWCFLIFLSSRSQTCSMGLMSGDCGRVCSTSGMLYNTKSFVFKAVSFRSLSCMKIKLFSKPIFSALSCKLFFKMSIYLRWSIMPSMKWKLPTAAALIQPQTSTEQPLCLTVAHTFFL